MEVIHSNPEGTKEVSVWGQVTYSILPLSSSTLALLSDSPVFLRLPLIPPSVLLLRFFFHSLLAVSHVSSWYKRDLKCSPLSLASCRLRRDCTSSCTPCATSMPTSKSLSFHHEDSCTKVLRKARVLPRPCTGHSSEDRDFVVKTSHLASSI